MSIQMPFNQDTINKCVCHKCPVQNQSECVRDQMSVLKSSLNEIPLNPQKIPKAYCVSGKSLCKGVNRTKPCICGSCEVYAMYHLSEGEPGGFYCFEGKSA
ncbi:MULTISPECIES: DUF2769 domain-containing protein [Dehalococcoides]|uniref:DUF2769 domain-containing protein n=1 Tax=Dehalococcoides mccartyi (strain VS) TaxID=311424 RepID=D2BGA6_DEHMV|nr:MULTISPECIES: DUF2769 domain-containing protein [Dehalococcoides]ACZ61356.1 hypothetical protein DhcVS_185 [Dehalococcoides mccartyi VS]AHB12995.1 hypothetical protein GY50_0210 [Dehalococcoides mccartyi GY50]AII57452.1 hypothetical protein X792_01385 [Dehalococcoides mccartyi CG1]QYY58507.2 DUF2769 domain-containing protein [Dehalococcoides mccartyi]BAQ34185.1 hypothetical protein UCH007_02270 [Dehalococcoides sp. UCH007]